MPKQPCRCIDISHYQGRPNFSQVAASGVLAMIHKATEGTGYSDPDRATNCSNALKAGIAVCTYHFLKHGNADAQMDYYLSVIEPEDGERVVVDYEDSACTIGDLHEAVQRLLDYGHDLQITVYSGNLLKEQLGNSHDDFLAQNTDLWLAQYTSGTPSWPKGTYPIYSLWQYSESGTIPGISDAAVDLNEFNGSDENLIKWIGPAGGRPEPGPPAVAQEVNITIAVEGDVRVTVNGQLIEA
jgi:lysozyme